MSLWIRCLCRRQLGEHFGIEAVKDAMARFDFAIMAEIQGLDHEVGYAAEGALRVESVESNVLLVYYRTTDDHFIRVESWRGRRAGEELSELARALGDSLRFERVLEHLREVRESVGFELKQGDLDAMGWPIAFYTAMWLAEQGDGLVEWEGTWFDPKTSYSDPIASA